MIENADVVRVLNSKRDNAAIVSTMTANNAHLGLPSVTSNEKLDFPLSGCMSKASSVALGLALARPERKVMVLDGDGSLLMNLGTLVTIGGEAPDNLYHIVLDNGMYAMTGGQPVPNAGNIDYSGLAGAAGYTKTFEFDDLEEWTTRIGEVLDERGPVLIVMKTAPEITDWVANPPKPSRRMPEAVPIARAAMTGQS